MVGGDRVPDLGRPIGMVRHVSDVHAAVGIERDAAVDDVPVLHVVIDDVIVPGAAVPPSVFFVMGALVGPG